jgi:hypothetical protein
MSANGCSITAASNAQGVMRRTAVGRTGLHDPRSLLNTGSETMAEDDETATARYIAGNVSTQLMLKVIIEIISTMADDPDKYRAGLKKKVLELADSMPLAEMDPARETKVRTFVRETIDNLLTNSKPD